MLILTRKEDESIMIGNEIEVSVVDVKGDQVKLGIKAPKDIKVYRREVFLAIQKENLAAAKTGTSLPDIGIAADKSRQGQSKPTSTSASSGGDQNSTSQSGAGNSGQTPAGDASS